MSAHRVRAVYLQNAYTERLVLYIIYTCIVLSVSILLLRTPAMYEGGGAGNVTDMTGLTSLLRVVTGGIYTLYYVQTPKGFHEQKVFRVPFIR